MLATEPYTEQVQAWLDAFGGAGNLVTVDAVSSRLSVKVHDDRLIDQPGLRSLGSRALVNIGPGSWHIILGPAARSIGADLTSA